MKIQIPDIMRPVIGGVPTVEVKAKTVREALAELAVKYPAIKPRLYEQEGKLYGYIDFFVNNQDIGSNLDYPLKETDELFILVTIYGG